MYIAYHTLSHLITSYHKFRKGNVVQVTHVKITSYKDFYQGYIRAMAIAGHNYECLYADAGANGRLAMDGYWVTPIL